MARDALSSTTLSLLIFSWGANHWAFGGAHHYVEIDYVVVETVYDVPCIGVESLSMVDYLAVEVLDPAIIGGGDERDLSLPPHSIRAHVSASKVSSCRCWPSPSDMRRSSSSGHWRGILVHAGRQEESVSHTDAWGYGVTETALTIGMMGGLWGLQPLSRRPAANFPPRSAR
jgi:hypothetical protein